MRTAAGAIALAALTAIPAGAAETESAVPRLTQPVHVSNGPDEAPGHSYTSPYVVVDPDNPRNAYAASVDIRNNRCTFFRSADGGRSWVRTKAAPAPNGFPFCTHDNGLIPHTFLAMGRDKTLYFLHIAWDVQDGGRGENRSVFLDRSTDGGDTWQSTPVHVNRGKTGNDIEKNVPSDLVVDTRTGEQDIVYVSYTASFPNPSSPARPGQPFVAASTDGGRTFGEPVNIVRAFYEDPANLPAEVATEQRKKENFGGNSVNLAVDARGTLFASFNRSSSNITPTAPPVQTYLARSTDKGKTFSINVLQPANPDQTGPASLQLAWGPAGSANGTLHAVWEGKIPAVQGERDILYRRSTDEGRTWSDVRAINDDDPSQLYSQFQPLIASAPNGRLEAVWFDMRDSAGQIATDVYGTTSTDGGVTWSSNRRYTDKIINRRIGPWKPGFGGDVRSPPGVSAADELTVVAWDDTRNGDLTTETEDIYAASAQYAALGRTGGLAPAVGYTLAAVIGVGAVGLLMLLVATVMRTRRGPALPAAPAAPGREPAGVG
jgi:hypothetical protein